MNLEGAVLKAKTRKQTLAYFIARERIKELLEQIEKIQPLLDHENADIRLRASQEIRDIHITINAVDEVGHRPARYKWKRIPKKKKVPRPDQNVFRPT